MAGLYATNYELTECDAWLSYEWLYVCLIDFGALFCVPCIYATDFRCCATTLMKDVIDESVCSDSLLLDVTCSDWISAIYLEDLFYHNFPKGEISFPFGLTVFCKTTSWRSVQVCQIASWWFSGA